MTERKTSSGPSEALESLLTRDPLLQKALNFAETAHEGQTRDDGTPYINHCIEVTRILFDWGITDPQKLSVGLLHDTEEDTNVTPADIRREFGEQVESWVEALSKFMLDEDAMTTRELREKETHKKVVTRNYLDPNVGIFKLADRLHNMRTLGSAREDKRVRKAVETLNIYSPLAESLGMWIVKTQLEDLSLPYSDPEIYSRYAKLFNEDFRTQDDFRKNMSGMLEKVLFENGIAGNVTIRENSVVRLKDKKLPFLNINDVVSFRIAVSGSNEETKRDESYRTLGILREMFKDTEDQSRFDDFYSTPKFNQYSAIQITLDLPEGATEIAITSDDKEDYNNWGVISLIRSGEKNIQDYALKLVITPTGQAKFLPPEATGLDLAYLMNKKMAAQAIGILINGTLCPISTVIPNGADVEIITGRDRIAPLNEDVEKSRPSTKKKAEKQYLEQKMRDAEIRGKQKVSKIISESGLLDLADLTKVDEHSDKLGKLVNISGAKRSLAVLYRLVDDDVVNANDLRELLESCHITKRELGFTSILVEGINKIDLSSFFSIEIGKRGGDIRYTEGGTRNGKTFSVRFVVQNLSRESESEIAEAFKTNSLISRVVVV